MSLENVEQFHGNFGIVWDWRCSEVIQSVLSLQEGFGELSTRKQSFETRNLKYEHYKPVEFLWNVRMSSLNAQTESPPIENFLATVLGTIWGNQLDTLSHELQGAGKKQKDLWST